jgi:hypothetical protein
MHANVLLVLLTLHWFFSTILAWMIGEVRGDPSLAFSLGLFFAAFRVLIARFMPPPSTPP